MKKHFTKMNRRITLNLIMSLLVFCFTSNLYAGSTSFSFKDATNVNNGSGTAATTEFGRYYLEIAGKGKFYRQPSAGSSISLTASTICETGGMYISTTSSSVTIDGASQASKYVQLFISPDYDITSITLYSAGGTTGRTLTTIATLAKSSTYNGASGNFVTLSGAAITGSITSGACSALTFTCAAGTYIPKNTYILMMESASGANPTKIDITFKDACTAPVYSAQPTDNQSECIGGTTTLGTVVADQSPTYQWYSNTSKTNTGGTVVSNGTGGATATFTPASDVAGTYYYYCVATNSTCTTASNAVQFTVSPSTAITSQSTTTATYGQNASASALTVSAVGSSLSYQWYQSSDASNATTGDDVTVGTNSNSYSPSTTTIGTSYYYCVVTGGCTSTTATSAVSGAIIITSPIPTVSRTSGSDPASTTYNVSLTPVVYTYVNVADDNNVIANWYTDNTYSTTTTAPSGLSLDKNVPAKTVTLSGTPLAIGTFYYKVTVNETNGNSISGSVVVAAPPAPTISLTSGNSTQAIIPGNAVTNIIYTLTNSTGASVTGLPTGLSGNYSSGTYTISGTLDAGLTAGSYPFIVTATALDGYSGAAVTATGTIVAKSLTAKNVLYLASDATTTSNDLFLAQLTNSVNYIVTKRTAQASFAGNYNGVDLIVLHESLTGGDAATSGHELNLIKSVDKPILNLKSYFYTGGSTPRWNWGTPNNGNNAKGIKVIQPSHPIFSGITIGDSLYMYGSYRAKNIQPTTITIGGYQIGKVVGGVAIHDVPASVRLTSGTSKYLLISLLNGAYNDLTADALKLLDNAMNYLLTGTQFAPLEISTFTVNGVAATIDNVANTITLQTTDVNLDHVTPVITLAAVSGTTVDPASGVEMNFYSQSHNYTVSDGVNTKIYAVTIYGTWTGLSSTSIPGVSFNGQTIQNNANIQLQVFDTLGRLVESSNKSITMSSYNKGVYIVKSANEKFKIIVTK